MASNLTCHLIAFMLGYIIDIIVGDPAFPLHPVRIMGRFISFLDRKLYTGDNPRDFRRGIALSIIVMITTTGVFTAIMGVSYFIHPILGIAVETLFTWLILATGSLFRESMRVLHSYKSKGIGAARKSVSMIVGRDTNVLDESGVIRATVETVAENTSDGIIAPMFYLFLGGPVLGMLYKSINTMDSMIGYKNNRYMFLGRAAAKIDDVVNFIPARLAALLMIAAAFLGGRDFKGREAARIFKRDRNKSQSPNACQCESVAAGALGVSLLGDCTYFGKLVKKETIGDPNREIQWEDIKRVNMLMLLTSLLGEVVFIVLMIGGIYAPWW